MVKICINSCMDKLVIALVVKNRIFMSKIKQCIGFFWDTRYNTDEMVPWTLYRVDLVAFFDQTPIDQNLFLCPLNTWSGFTSKL